MIHHDYMFKGFKVRTYRQPVMYAHIKYPDSLQQCFAADAPVYHFRTMVWSGNLVYRGEAMPEKPDAEEDAIKWIEFILSV